MAVRNRNARTLIALPSDFVSGIDRASAVVLTHANITTLNATPFQLVPAPGPGKWNQLVGLAVFFDWTADYIPNAQNLRVETGAGSLLANNFLALLDPGEDFVIEIPPLPGNSYTVAGIVNRNFLLRNLSAEFGGGHAANRWYVRTVYRTWDLTF